MTPYVQGYLFGLEKVGATRWQRELAAGNLRPQDVDRMIQEGAFSRNKPIPDMLARREAYRNLGDVHPSIARNRQIKNVISSKNPIKRLQEALGVSQSPSKWKEYTEAEKAIAKRIQQEKKMLDVLKPQAAAPAAPVRKGIMEFLKRNKKMLGIGGGAGVAAGLGGLGLYNLLKQDDE